MTILDVVQDDITRLDVDAIVNAANNSLMGGGGVDGAIHRAGGPDILEACKAIVARSGPLPTGKAVITPAGRLKARHVIHTVGPVWRGGSNQEDQLLSDAYLNSLLLATENHLKSIAFPNISTGVYGFPRQEAAAIAVQTVRDFLRTDRRLNRVVFCCYDAGNFDIYSTLLK
jgi:O-acetyl-ADP-ribose deacetylase